MLLYYVVRSHFAYSSIVSEWVLHYFVFFFFSNVSLLCGMTHEAKLEYENEVPTLERIFLLCLLRCVSLSKN